MPPALRAIDEPTLVRLIRYALATAMDHIHLRPGCRPLLEGLGPEREVSFRQLTGDDTRAVAGIVLAHARPPCAAAEDASDAAFALFPLWHLPGRALVELHLEPAPGGLALRLDLLRPLEDPSEIALLEG
jgi:hypothetical protein